jgi:hypothetical protein
VGEFLVRGHGSGVKLFPPSVEFVNGLINAPGVRPTAQAGKGWLEAAPFMSEPRNAAIAYVGGAMLFEHASRGVYGGHVFILPGYRGAQALAFGQQAISWLFSTVGASKLVAAAPRQLPQVRFYCRRLGLRSVACDLFQEYFEVEADQWVV